MCDDFHGDFSDSLICLSHPQVRTELHINALVRPLHIRFLLRRRTNPRAEIEQSHTGNTAQAQLKVARTIADLGGDADR